MLSFTVKRRSLTALAAALFVAGCASLFPFLGAEFLPKLDEGAIAINVNRLASVLLPEAVKMTTTLEQVVKEFPEVTTVVSRIGRPEVATDPMGPNMGDTYVFLKPRPEWTSATNREDLVAKFSERLTAAVPTMAYSFSQPIQFRMQELIEGIGARSDVVIKVFGDDLGTLKAQGEQIARVISTVKGASDVKVEQVTGLPVLEINIDRHRTIWHQCSGCTESDSNCCGRHRSGPDTRRLSSILIWSCGCLASSVPMRGSSEISSSVRQRANAFL